MQELRIYEKRAKNIQSINIMNDKNERFIVDLVIFIDTRMKFYKPNMMIYNKNSKLLTIVGVGITPQDCI